LVKKTQLRRQVSRKTKLTSRTCLQYQNPAASYLPTCLIISEVLRAEVIPHTSSADKLLFKFVAKEQYSVKILFKFEAKDGSSDTISINAAVQPAAHQLMTPARTKQLAK